MSAKRSFTLEGCFQFTRDISPATLCNSLVSRVFHMLPRMRMLARTSTRSLDLSKLPLPLPKLITLFTTSTSSQFSYNVQPPTPPKPSNNQPIQSIPQPNTQSCLPTLSPTTTARSSPPPGSASIPNPRYATISHEQTKTTHQVSMADQTHH